MSVVSDKIKAALTKEEHTEFQRVMKQMATDAITWRNLLQDRLNMDVAESFEALSGEAFPFQVPDLIEWTESAEKALGAEDHD